MSLLRHEIGDEISHRTIHRWAQEEGKKLREEEEARQEAVFARAEKVGNDGKQREIVVLEVEGGDAYCTAQLNRGWREVGPS